MTDEEKAATFIKRHFGTYTEAFRNSLIPLLVRLIQEAREQGRIEEREACAKVAETCDKSTHPADVADAIRARSLP